MTATATTTKTFVDRNAEVQRLWSTQVILGRVRVDGYMTDDLAARIDSSSREFEELDPADYLNDLSELEETWSKLFSQLDPAAEAQPQIQMKLEIWRAGYEDPMLTARSKYMGWLFLHGTAARHSESGTVAVLDPRAGSSMSAVPGLPWGRSMVLQSTPGSLGIVPGWLTASVLPLEADQTSVVLRAFGGHE